MAEGAWGSDCIGVATRVQELGSSSRAPVYTVDLKARTYRKSSFCCEPEHKVEQAHRSILLVLWGFSIFSMAISYCSELSPLKNYAESCLREHQDQPPDQSLLHPTQPERIS